MALKTRKPTGRSAWPLILVEGGEKTGKSYIAAQLTASEKVGRSYWIEFGPEGTADEYGQIPGVRYEIVEHDGSFAGLYQAVDEVRTEAHAALAAGEPPMVLTIDTMSAEWDLLKDWATSRAKGSAANRKKLALDPHAEIVVSNNYWNDANSRHRKLMHLLTTFPGICILLARGKDVVAMEDGRPVEGKRDYRVEGQKGLGYEVSCWVRLSRDERPQVIGMRSALGGFRPGIEPAKPLPNDWSLEWLVFDLLKLDPANTQVRSVVEAKQERLPEQIRAEALHPETGPERMGELWTEAKQSGYESVIVSNENKQDELLMDLIGRIGKARRAAQIQQAPQPEPQEQAPPVEPVAPGSGPLATAEQHAEMTGLWRQTGMDEEERLRFTSEIVGRQIATSQHLTAAEASQVTARVTAWIDQQAEAEVAAEQKAVPA